MQLSRSVSIAFKSTFGSLTQDELRALGVGDDYWLPHPTTYYRFALTQPALDGLLVALPSPASVGELGDALAKGPLDDEDRQYLLDLGELARAARRRSRRPARGPAAAAAARPLPCRSRLLDRTPAASLAEAR